MPPLRRSLARRTLLLLVATGVAGACGSGRSDSRVQALVLERFSQAGVEEVFLNEALTFQFSGPLDPISVHRQSLRVQGPGGLPVAGRFEVDGSTVRFLPRLAATATLEDGGFLPGQEYVVELPGFPEHNTIVSRLGLPLRYGYRLRFRTVERRAGRSPFLDGSPSRGPQIESIVPRYGRVGPDDAIRFRLSEPVLPWTVGPGAVRLWIARTGTDSIEELDVRVALAQDEFGAEIAVRRDRGGFLPGETYFLQITPDLLDFSGSSLTPPLATPLSFLCESGPEGPRGEVRFAFDRPGWRDESFEGDRGLLQPDLHGWLRPGLLQEAGSGASGTLHVAAGLHRTVATDAPGLASLRRLVVEDGATLRVEGDGTGEIAVAEDVSLRGTLDRVGDRGGPLLRIFANGDLDLWGAIVLQATGGADSTGASPGLWIRVGGRIRLHPGASIRFEGVPGAIRLEDADGVVEGLERAVSGLASPPGVHPTDASPPLSLYLAATREAVVRTRYEQAPDPDPLWEGVRWNGDPGAAEVTIRVAGAPADPRDPSRPDTTRETPFTEAIEDLRGLPFVRLEIRVVIPAGNDAAMSGWSPSLREVRLLYRS